MRIKCLVAVIHGKVLRNQILTWHDRCLASLVIVKDHPIARVVKDRFGYGCHAYVSDQEVERLVSETIERYNQPTLQVDGHKYNHPSISIAT